MAAMNTPDNPPANHLGALVRARRRELGLTQAELAAAVGVSRQSINSIERDRYVPSLQLALTFARVFGLATDEIFWLHGK